jgi:DNA-binding response OmpR family regulator
MGGEAMALLVGGDAPTRAMLRYLLECEGCAVVDVPGVPALGHAPRADEVALLVVLASQAEHNVSDTLAALRRVGYHAPTLVLAQGLSLQLRRRAFALGAVDVVGLPMDTRVLLARLRSALAGATSGAGRSGGASERILQAGGLRLDTMSREVSAGTNGTVRLTQRETLLLQALMAAPRRTLGRHELLDRVWGEDYAGTGNVLEATIGRLRQKLRQAGAMQPYVRTVRGQGYAFEPPAAVRPSGEIAAAGPARVLVVDDDAATVELISETLAGAGYAVTHGTGTEALALARRLHPAVILLDIIMPDIDGAELCRGLRADPETASIPVVALSASSTLRWRAHELPAHDYLAKPFDVDELLLRVGRWAGGDVPLPSIPAGGSVSAPTGR